MNIVISIYEIVKELLEIVTLVISLITFIQSQNNIKKIGYVSYLRDKYDIKTTTP